MRKTGQKNDQASVKYKLIRSNRKTLAMELKPEGLLVRAELGRRLRSQPRHVRRAVGHVDLVLDDAVRRTELSGEDVGGDRLVQRGRVIGESRNGGDGRRRRRRRLSPSRSGRTCCR